MKRNETKRDNRAKQQPWTGAGWLAWGRMLLGGSLGWVLALVAAVPAVLGQSNPLTLDGDPLKVTVYDEGTMAAQFNQPPFFDQYFGGPSCGTLLYLNGSDTGQSFGSGAGSFPLAVGNRYTPVSQTQPDAWTVVTVFDAGASGVRITQRTTYVNGQKYFKMRYEIANNGLTTFNDLRFFRGLDAYFWNDDNAQSYWDSGLSMVYLRNPGASGIMGFYANASTPAAHYFGGNFSTANTECLSGSHLSDTANPAFDDAGYALEWVRASLAPGATWVVEAFEKWTEAGDVQVYGPADATGAPGATVTRTFTVQNFQAGSDTFDVAVTSVLGWTLSAPATVTVGAAASATVDVEITIPGGATNGAVDVVRLTVTSQASASVTNSDVAQLTVVVPPKLSQTISFAALPDVLTTNTVGLSGTASSGLDVAFSVVSGAAELSGTNLTFSGAGPVTVRASQAGDATYDPAPEVERTFEVTKATATVVLDGLSATYAGAPQVATATTTPSGLTVDFTYDGGATAPTVAGSYAVVGTIDDPMYQGATNGTLVVAKAALTATADPQTRPYGDANPALTVSYTGFAPGEDATVLTTAPSGSTTAGLTSPIGAYPITLTGGSATNYDLTLVNGVLTVSKAALSVQGNNASRAYGAANPTFTASMTGLRNSDDITASFTVAAVPATPVGSYRITLMLVDPEGKLGQYNVTLRTGTLSVTNAVLVGTVASGTRAYGAANPAYSVAYAGFANGENESVLSGALGLSCLDGGASPVGATTPVGDYSIEVTSGQTAPNYEVVYVPGTLSITKAALTVTAQDASRVYGASNPTLTASATGFVNGETAAVLGGTLSVTTVADAASGVGSYPIVPGGYTSSNYAFTYVNGALAVTPAALTGTVADAERTYGEENPDFEVSYSGFVNGEDASALTGAVTYSCLQTNGQPVSTNTVVGTYPIEVTTGASSTNYTILYAGGTLTVTQAVLTATADSKSRAYGAANPALTGSLVGVKNDDALTLDYTTTAVADSVPGTYPIEPEIADPDGRLTNYLVTTNAGELTVGKATLTVTAENQSRPYGAANPVLTLAYSGFASGEDASDLATAPAATTAATGLSGLGHYAIVPAGGVSGNYDFVYVNGTLSVTKALLTVLGDDASRAYGAANPVFTADMSGLVNGDNIVPVLSTTAGASSPTGVYDIDLTLDDPEGRMGQYDVIMLGGTLTVTNAVLTGTASSASRLYGEANPAFSVTYSGWANGEGAGLLTGSLSYRCVDGQGVATGPATSPGGYAIHVQTGQTAPNYTVRYVDGLLTVGQAPLTVTAQDASRVYGAANPAFTATVTGYVNGETASVLGGTLTVQSAATAASDAGTYAIQGSGLSSSNYAITWVPGTLTVTQADLTGTVEDVSRAYGATNPVFTVTYSGFVNGDEAGVVTGPMTFRCVDGADEPVTTNTVVGVYPAQVLAGQTAVNYAITYVDGSLTVTQAVLTVHGDAKSRVYGAANPVLTATLSGFQNGEDSSAITGDPVLTTEADAASPAGDYAIEVAAGDLSATNYVFAVENGVLTVAKAQLTIIADDQTRHYGEANPTFTWQVAGFVGDEDASVLSGAPALTSVGAVTSPAGTYPIVAAQGSLSATNYAFAFTEGTLTVDKASLIAAAEPQSRVYGAANPVLTLAYEGFANGEGPADLDAAPTAATTATPGSPAGDYAIVVTGGSSANYTLTLQDSVLTVTKASLTVAADDARRGYGDANPAFTGAVTGLVNGDEVTASYASAADAASDVGTYAIVPTPVDPGTVLGNYELTVVPGTLTVTNAVVVGTVANATRVYGETNPVFSVTYSGWKNGEGTGLLDQAATFECLETGGTPVGVLTPKGDYSIRVANAPVAPNYAVEFVAGTLSVTPAALTVTAADADRTYGAANPALTGVVSGAVSGDSLAPAYQTAATPASPVGSYDIVPVFGDPAGRLSNYTVTTNKGTLTIDKAALSVTAGDATRAYGAANPALLVSYSGFMNGEDATALTTAPTATTAATTTSTVGEYAIVAAGGASPNYAFSYHDGTLTVTKAQLTVTAEGASRAYGAANPELSATLEGAVAGDGLTVTLSTAATAASPPGEYAIGVQVNDPQSRLGQYNVVIYGAKLTVTRASLTITGVSATRVYGAPNPALTATISGLVAGETEAVLGGALSVQTTATAASTAGTYPVVPAGLTSGNYDITYVNGTLTVVPAFTFSDTPGDYVVGAPPVQVDETVSAAGGNTLDYAGAVLTVTVVTNSSPLDLLGVQHVGTGSGEVGVDGATVTYGGEPFGVLDGGTNGQPLVITLGSGTTASMAAALMAQVTYATTSTNAASATIELALRLGATVTLSQRTFVLDRPPVAAPDVLTAAGGVALEIPASLLLDNDADADEDELTVTEVDETSSGGATLSLVSGRVVYTPPATPGTQDTFTYRVSDGRGGSTEATVTLEFLVLRELALRVGDTDDDGGTLTMAGEPGQDYILEFSTDLVNWTPLATVTASALGIIEHVDAAVRSRPMRFYRASAAP